MTRFEDPCFDDRIDCIYELLLPGPLDLEDPLDEVVRDAQDSDQLAHCSFLLEQDPQPGRCEDLWLLEALRLQTDLVRSRTCHRSN